MAWKTFIKGWLTFSKKDRLGAMAFIFVLLLIFFLPRLFPKKGATLSIQEDSLLLNAIDTLQTNFRVVTSEEESNFHSRPYEQVSNKGFIHGALFNFDPNTLSPDGWQKLGLNDKTIRILINYRNKGGRFYKPVDLKKVWTMPVGFYERVKKHITIADNTRTDPHNTYPTFPSSPFKRKEKNIEPVDINKGDTDAFIALPGIGPVLAGRIINFRTKLGGFHSIEQVAETYGLPDSTFQKLKPYFNLNDSEFRKLNINGATKEELNAHPYIDWKLAKAIVEYRNQHGNYQSIDDLKNIMILDEATFLKIKSYLSLN